MPGPPELWFIVAGLSQYAGAAIAVTLFGQLGAPSVAFWRVAFGAVALLPIAVVRRSGPPRQRAPAAIVALGVSLAAMNLCFYQAIASLPLARAVALEFTGPVIVAAVGARTRRSALAVALATLAVLAVTWRGLGTGRGDLAGVGWALLAAASWAGYILAASRVARGGADLVALVGAMAVAALLLAPFGVGTVQVVVTHPRLLGVAAATALLSTAIPYGLEQSILARLPAARFALLLALLPVTAGAVGALLLGQQPSPSTVAAVLLVGGAVALARGSATP